VKKLIKLFFVIITPLFVLNSCSRDTVEKADIKEEQIVLTAGSGKTYKIIPDRSNLEWEAAKVTGKHHGTVNISGGELIADGNELQSGRFEVEMASIRVLDIQDPESNLKLTNHLKSDDFFSVENNPVSVFEITNIVPKTDDAGNTHQIEGNLTIKGITNNISFPAKVMIDNNRIVADAEFKVDRTKWDIKFRSGKFFENLGDNLIYDDFTIRFNIAAQ
jgi:polyisoprenoid-binding protein YceI